MSKADVLRLPNIRRLFVPDPGFIIIDADLAGADAQVVAWECNDADLKKAFQAGLKLHIKNARDLWPAETANLSDAALKQTDRPGGIYHNCKRGVHATNYGARPRTLAITLGWTIQEAQAFQDNWFTLHPGIRDWHQRTEGRLLGRRAPDGSFLFGPPRSVSNAFGYRIIYFDRPESVLPEALAWVPQSTVAIVCRRGSIALERYFADRPDLLRPAPVGRAGCLLQVHDSLVFQIRQSEAHWLLPKIKDLLRVEVPYDDPLVIPWGFAGSDQSWGDASAEFLQPYWNQ